MGSSPLPPRLLQIIGLSLLIAFVVYWMITGKESELLVGAAVSLVLAAQYERVRTVLRDVTKPGPLQSHERSKTPRDVDTEEPNGA